MVFEAEILEALAAYFSWFYRPGWPLFVFFFPHRLGCKGIEELVVSGMACYKLSSQVRGELGDLKATGILASAFQLIAVVFALCSLLQVDAKRGSHVGICTPTYPSDAAHLQMVFGVIKRRLISHELGKEKWTDP